MLSFPNKGHMIILWRTVFFQITSFSRVYIRIIYQKTKGKVSLGLCWENKTYKLKGSIETHFH